MKEYPIVLCIAGSEPLGSAGVQADIKSVSACGAYAAGALTCIVNEDTRTIKEVFPLPARLAVGQAESVLSDVGAASVKTGMLFTAELIGMVADLLERYPSVPAVVDPVMVEYPRYPAHRRGCRAGLPSAADSQGHGDYAELLRSLPAFRPHLRSGRSGYRAACAQLRRQGIGRGEIRAGRTGTSDGFLSGRSGGPHPSLPQGPGRHPEPERYRLFVLFVHRGISGARVLPPRGRGPRRGLYHRSHPRRSGIYVRARFRTGGPFLQGGAVIVSLFLLL